MLSSPQWFPLLLFPAHFSHFHHSSDPWRNCMSHRKRESAFSWWRWKDLHLLPHSRTEWQVTKFWILAKYLYISSQITLLDTKDSFIVSVTLSSMVKLYASRTGCSRTSDQVWDRNLNWYGRRWGCPQEAKHGIERDPEESKFCSEGQAETPHEALVWRGRKECPKLGKRQQYREWRYRTEQIRST